MVIILYFTLCSYSTTRVGEHCVTGDRPTGQIKIIQQQQRYCFNVGGETLCTTMNASWKTDHAFPVLLHHATEGFSYSSCQMSFLFQV